MYSKTKRGSFCSVIFNHASVCCLSISHVVRFCLSFLMEQFLSETVRAASLHFVYLKRFFPLQSQLTSWEFGSLNAEIDCWSSWVIFTVVAGDVLPSCSHVSLYGLRMIEAKQQREELNPKLHAYNHCLTLCPVRKTVCRCHEVKTDISWIKRLPHMHSHTPRLCSRE